MTMGNLAGAGEALDGSLNTIFSEFKLLRDETGVFRSTATKLELQPHEGRSKNVNNYNRVVAFDLIQLGREFGDLLVLRLDGLLGGLFNSATHSGLSQSVKELAGKPFVPHTGVVLQPEINIRQKIRVA